MDRQGVHTYLDAMAHRLFLTLLAVLTGLAAQIGPAEARASQVAAMQVASLVEVSAVKAPRAPEGLAQLPEPGLRNTRRHALALRSLDLSPPVPAVLAGIDRARE